MKKILLLISVFVIGITLTGCFPDTPDEECDSGFSLVDGECVEDTVPVCDEGEVLNTDTLECEPVVPTCEDGEELNTETNECEPVAPTCEDDEVLNEETNECELVVPVCEDDEVLNVETNECDPKPLVCEDGYHEEDGECVEDEAVLTELFIMGVADISVDAGVEVDVLVGVIVIGSDGENYTDMLLVDSDDCEVGDGMLMKDTGGSCTITYSVVVNGILGRETRTVTWNVDPNAIDTLADMPNQDFSLDDFTGWATEGTLVLTHDAEGYLVVAVSEFGPNPWSQNIGFPGQTILPNATYTVSYTLKTEYPEGRDVTFFVEDVDAGYAKYFEVTETLTNEFQTFTFEFTPTAFNDDTKLGIFLGNTSNPFLGNVIIDSIVITQTLGETVPEIHGAEDLVLEIGDVFDPLAGVTAIDFEDGDLTASIVVGGDTVDTSADGVFVVTYTVTNEAGNVTVVERTVTVVGIVLDEANDALLDDFFSLDLGWGAWNADWNSTSVVVTFDGTAAIFDIADTGDANWNIQLFQEGLTVVDTKTYRITFDAMSTVGRDIRVKLIMADATELEMDVTLTDTMQTFTVDLTYSGADQGAKLDFELGLVDANVASVVTIDNVMVEEFDGTAVVADTDQVMNGTFDTPMEVLGFTDTMGWYNTIVWGQPIFDATFVDGQLVINNFKDGDNDFGTNYWDSITRYYGLTLVEGGTYTIKFDAMSSVAGGSDIMFKMETSDFAQDQVYTIAETMTEYTFTFVYDGTTTDAAALLFFVGGTEHTITVGSIDIYLDTTTAGQTNAPMINGPADMVLDVNTAFDPLEGVTALDVEDGVITLDASNVTVAGPNAETVFDPAVEGDWVFTYTVTDSDMNETVVTITISLQSMVFEATDLMPNGTFDLNPWGSWNADWNSTSVNVTFDGSAAIFDIADTGDANWNIQLFQEGLAVVDTKTYRVTFDAMSTVGRDIRVKLIMDDASELEGDVTLTDAMQTFTVDLTYAGTDQGAKVDFELGLIDANVASVVTIDNVMVEEFDGTAVVADTNQVENGDFTVTNIDGWTSWSRDWDPVITSSLAVEWNELVFRYDGVGDAPWNNQVNFDGIEFEFGATYKLSFDAKGDMARDFKVNIYDGALNHISGDLALGTDFASYEHVFTYIGDADAKVEFQLGAVTANSDGSVFYLDNVVIEKLVQDEVLMNGEFDELKWVPWSADWMGMSSSVEIVDGALVYSYAGGLGDQSWQHQLSLWDLTFVPGAQYKLTFDAKGDVARKFLANVWSGNSIGHDTAPLDLTTDWVSYEYVFTYDATASTDAKLEFKLGLVDAADAGAMLYLDNVVLAEWDGTTLGDNMVMQSTFEEPLGWGAWAGEGATSTASVVNGELVIDVVNNGAGVPWATQVFQEGLTFVSGLTYTIEFDAKSSVARQMNVNVGEPLTVDPWWIEFKAVDEVELGTEWAHYTVTFTMSLDTNENGKLVFELGNVGAAGAVDAVVNIDNVIIYPTYNPQP